MMHIIHKWSRWSEMLWSGEDLEAYQERKCSTCGLIKIRWVEGRTGS